MQPGSSSPRSRKPSAAQAPFLAAPAKRPVVFELHIRPLFRTLDREHMSFVLNLWKYQDVPPAQRVAFYQRIQAKLNAADPALMMPPPNEGGPWPQEWLDLLERWIQAGAPRLDRATVDETTLRAVRDSATGTVDLFVTGQKPSSGHAVWLERNYDPERLYNEYLPAEFIVYQEQRSTAPTTPTPFSIDDFFDVPLGATTVTIVDNNGPHNVIITV